MPKLRAEELLAALDDLIGEIEKSALGFRIKQGDLRFDALKQLRDDLRNQAGAAAAAPPPGPETQEDRAGAEGPIDGFFRAVGEGVIQAQRRLDDRSLEYSRGRAGMAPASLFRIPRTTAEIQFGIEKFSEKGVDIFFASSKKGVREQIQHKVSFDVVAVPPPPDVVEAIERYGRAPVDFVQALADREALRRRLQAVIDAGDTDEDESALAKTLQGQLDEALVLEGEGGAAVVWARGEAADKGRELVLLFVPRDSAAPITLEPNALKYTGNRRALREFLDFLLDEARRFADRKRG